jgi:predicted dehydrogenase
MIGVVVVGTGFGCITHVRALRAAGFDVVAVVGRDPARTAERAARFGVSRACTSLDAALELPGVDAITIATPPHTHAELALAAIAAGRHVLCEKPFARDTAEAVGVLAAAESAGIVHLLGTEFRWDPGQATLARAVASGVIGEPRLATVILHVPALADMDAQVPPWWADGSSGGGWLGAHGSQVIDQVRVTLGEFAGVSASLVHVGSSAMTAEDSFVVHFRLRSGVVGVLQSSAADWGPYLIETRVAGTKGTTWVDGLSTAVWVSDALGTRRLSAGDDLPKPQRPEPLPAGVLQTAYEKMIAHGLDLPPYTRLAEVFRDRILGRPVPVDPPRATFVDGVEGMAVLDAVRRSAAEGRWVDVERAAFAEARER